MKYEFSVPVLTDDGVTAIPTSETDKTPFQAAKALMNALLADTPENANTKMQRYDLFLKIRSGATDFSGAEVTALRTAALLLPTLIAGQLVKILDQASS
jgi:hypothetical protein